MDVMSQRVQLCCISCAAAWLCGPGCLATRHAAGPVATAVIGIQRRMHDIVVYARWCWCGARRFVCRLLVHSGAYPRSDSILAANAAGEVILRGVALR